MSDGHGEFSGEDECLTNPILDQHTGRVYATFASSINKTIMTKRINVILPVQTLSVLDRITSKGNRSHFITRAVHFYVESYGKQNLREQLKAGYQAHALEDLEQAAKWFPLEEEAELKATVQTASVKQVRNPKRK